MIGEKKIELKEIGLQQTGKAILITWGSFALGLLGSFAYSFLISHQIQGIFFHLRNAFIVFIVVYGIMQLFNKKKIKDTAHQFLIKINDNNITIEIDHEMAFNGDLHELKAIRTLEPSNKKNDVQGQIYINDHTFSLASSLNGNNKNEFDEFVRYCEKKLKMQIKTTPFSIYTHNLQGIKYLEYFNPVNPLL